MKILIPIIFITLFFSCQKKIKEENINLKKKIEILSKDNLRLNRNINVFKKENTNLKSDLNIMTNKAFPTCQEVEKKIKNLFEFSVYSNISKDTLSKGVIDLLIPNNYSTVKDGYEGLLFYLCRLVNPDRNQDFRFKLKNNISDVIKLNNKEYLIHYMWRRLDRSPENIDLFLNEKNKEFIYSLLKKNNIYENSGLKELVKSLLISYNDLNSNIIYSKNEQSGKITCSDDTNIIVENTNIKIKKLLSENTMYVGGTAIMSEFYKYYWVYSFWERRSNEDNLEVVYKLITELNNEMELNNDEYYEE